MRTLLVVLLLFLSACATLPGKNTKDADIRLLIRGNGDLETLYEMAVNTFVAPIEQNEKTRGEEAKVALWRSRVETFVHQRVYENPQLMDQLVEVYDKYYTHEEIREILRFQQSSVGQKIRQFKPTIFNESYQIGEQWGRRLMEEFELEIKSPSREVAQQKQ